MNEQQTKRISKFLSLVLRHQPELIGLELDENGWADVETLISLCARHGQSFTKEQLEEVVDTNDKKRFAFNNDHSRIRASQGHSINIELDLQPATPPDILYHGTVHKFMDNIRKEGLQKMSRQHVHLSKDRETAEKVASRRGVPVILTVRAAAMHADGIIFHLSDNGVWLTDHVPAKYIDI